METNLVGEITPSAENERKKENGKEFSKLNMSGSNSIKERVSKYNTNRTISSNMSLTERFIFIILLSIMTVGATMFLWNLQSSFLVTVPAHDGTLKEGLIGTPGAINPLLASSAPDRVLTSLIYSGLMKANPEGELVYEISEDHSISEEGTEYIFTIRENATFHDGFSVTADDVVFTVERVKDPAVKSSLAPEWAGVEAEALDQRTVKFTLPESLPNFMELTTLGILPEHIWGSVNSNRFAFSSFNIEPIGSGPYRISTVSMENGSPKQYKLRAFESYVRNEPYITNVIFNFYQQEREAWNALQRGEIDALAGFSPQRSDTLMRTDLDIRTSPLPRVFSIFINQNNNEHLADANVRLALSKAVNREEILSEVINGYGEAITGPLPPKALEGNESDREEDDGSLTPEEMLESAGWDYDENTKRLTKDGDVMSIEISTVTNSDLQRAAEIIKNNWEQIGIETSIALYSNNELNQHILRPRDFEGLLFGYILDRDLDLYPFWHSSERNDPGMNLSLYTNIAVDELLEEHRQETSPEDRLEIRKDIERIVSDDVPAIFLYTPHFLYVLPKSLENIEIGHLTTPEERFLNIHEWFITTDRVWSFLL